MPNNKKHHYVPRFYLKRFSGNGKSIGLYNLSKKLNIHTANLKKQCYKDYFYGKDQVTENTLSEIERLASTLFTAIDKVGEVPPRRTIPRLNLIYYVLIQQARTRHSADVLDEMHDKIIKHSFKEKIESKIENVNLDDFILGIRDVSQYALDLAVRSYPLLLDLRAKLIVNQTSVEFITSDNPVVMYNPFMLFRKYGGNTGYASKGLQIYFPIDPEKIIVLYDSRVYRFGVDNKKVIKIFNKQDVYNLNALQACSCYENIYFRNEKIDTEALHRKVLPYLRTNKANIFAFSEKNTVYERSEIVITYKEDITINVKLSFVRIRQNAIKWRLAFRKLKQKPVAVIRDERLYDAFDEFRDLDKSEEYSQHEFEKFYWQKYGKFI